MTRAEDPPDTTDGSLRHVEETLRPYVFMAMRSYAVVVLEDLIMQMRRSARESHAAEAYQPFLDVLAARIELERRMARIDGGTQT